MPLAHVERAQAAIIFIANLIEAAVTKTQKNIKIQNTHLVRHNRHINRLKDPFFGTLFASLATG